MKKILFDILIIVLVISIFLDFSLCDPVYLLDLLEADSQIFTDIFDFGFLCGFFLFILFDFVCDTFLLIFRKVRKSLEKQGKE